MQLQEPLFEIDGRGRYTHVNKSIFTRSYLNTITLFTEHREMSALGVNISCNFSLIENSLYLTFDQLCELFEVSDKVIRDHLNNIYGFWLHSNQGYTGGGKSPPQSLTILDIPVMFNKPSNTLDLNGGGGGGTQNVMFYHHDVIIDLASRMNNTRARVINQFVKNVVHEYNKNFHVVNPAIHNPGNENLLGMLQHKAANFSQARINEQNTMRGQIHRIFSKCNDSSTISGRDWGFIYSCMHNTSHASVTGLTAAGIKFMRCNHNLPNCGLQHWNKTPTNLNDANNALNYYRDPELMIRGGDFIKVIYSIEDFMDQQGLLDWRTALRASVYFSVGRHIAYKGENLLDYDFTAPPPYNDVTAKRANTHVKAQMNAYRQYLKSVPTLTENELKVFNDLSEEDAKLLILMNENEFIN